MDYSGGQFRHSSNYLPLIPLVLFPVRGRRPIRNSLRVHGRRLGLYKFNRIRVRLQILDSIRL